MKQKLDITQHEKENEEKEGNKERRSKGKQMEGEMPVKKRKDLNDNIEKVGRKRKKRKIRECIGTGGERSEKKR